ncbi:hypothetical protein [Rhizobium azibense]|uniref:Uncharacterized protein n=1 Tax=Rhizobium azibense TaxID=1136135 RepID=A0A4R3REY9_9HYPH|nr:hypothetical protein [Rhizobium azibense]TCU34103.1 hypothetical protein EV129_11386 [Rhizobium azibense]
MTFAFLAFLAINGEIHTFVLDQHLSYSDCQTAIHKGVKAAEIIPGVTIDLSGAPLVCELETAPAVTVAAAGE